MEWFCLKRNEWIWSLLVTTLYRSFLFLLESLAFLSVGYPKNIICNHDYAVKISSALFHGCYRAWSCTETQYWTIFQHRSQRLYDWNDRVPPVNSFDKCLGNDLIRDSKTNFQVMGIYSLWMNKSEKRIGKEKVRTTRGLVSDWPISSENRPAGLEGTDVM